MTITRFAVEVGNAHVGPLNTAIWDLHTDTAYSTSTSAQTAAQCIAMSSYMLMAADSYIASIKIEEVGSDGAIPLPWPADEYDILQAADSANLPDLADYGSTFGSGGITALGTGLTVSEYSIVPGRSTTGRIYTPYLRASALNSVDGLVASATISTVQTGYRAYILGTEPSVPDAEALGAVVYSPKLGTTQLITNPKVSVRPCRLKTRTR